MTKAAFNALAVVAALSAGLLPTLVCAYELDPHLDCKSDAHTFIGELLDDQ